MKGKWGDGQVIRWGRARPRHPLMAADAKEHGCVRSGWAEPVSEPHGYVAPRDKRSLYCKC